VRQRSVARSGGVYFFGFGFATNAIRFDFVRSRMTRCHPVQPRLGRRFYTWITVLGTWWRSAARIRIFLGRLPDLPRIYRGYTHDPQRVRDPDAGVNANVVRHLGRRPETEGAVAYPIDGRA
jgi:hypothetical protein